jgi:hypothetical protein
MARAAVDDGLALEKLRAWVEVSGGQVGAFEMVEAASTREDPGKKIYQPLLLGKDP